MIGYDGVSEHEHISNIPEILCILEFSDWRYPTPRLDADSHKQRSCTPTTLCNARVLLLGLGGSCGRVLTYWYLNKPKVDLE